MLRPRVFAGRVGVMASTAHVSVGTRKLLVVGLLAAFVTQAAFVYGDDVAAGQAALSPTELRGRQVFLSHNCYACHQIYGFGGFLGPDLTNAAQRVPRARLEELLTHGSKQMPAFALPAADIDAVEAYLRAVDRTGVGVARYRVPPPLDAVRDALCGKIAGAAEEVQRGHQVFTTFCTACHLPLRANPLGAMVAPDPSGIAARLSVDEIERTITEGRPQRGMPPAPITAAQRRDVVAFLVWLASCRADLVTECGAGTEQSLPWWEFR
ncbi:MAG: cytochrome c [Planctomycetota bacterium]